MATERHSHRTQRTPPATLAIAVLLVTLAWSQGAPGAGQAEPGESGLARGAELRRSGDYWGAIRSLGDALDAGLSTQNQVLAHYHLGKCHWALGHREEALAEYRLALQLDNTVLESAGHHTPQWQWCLDEIQTLRPQAATVVVWADVPDAKYYLAQVMSDGRSGETYGPSPAPGRIYGALPGRYTAIAWTAEKRLAAWEMVTVNPGRSGSAPQDIRLKLRRPCLLYVRVVRDDTGSDVTSVSDIKVVLQNGITLTVKDAAADIPLACPVGRHRVEVKYGSYGTFATEVVFESEGERKWLPAIRIGRHEQVCACPTHRTALRVFG